jgi:hypothetical protein
MIYVVLTLGLITGANLTGITYAQTNHASRNGYTGDNSTESNMTVGQSNTITNTTSSPDPIPTAQSVYDTGVMTLPVLVKAAIIFLPDEAHHPPADDKTISPKNPNYLPGTLVVPEGTEVAFAHDDPNHIHVGIVKDKSGNVAWTTIPAKFPGSSDSKVLDMSGSPYTVSDKQFSPPMEGKIVVKPQKSTGDLTVGGFFCPTKQLSNCKSQFSKAGFQILSEYDFVTKSVQQDITGPNTLLIYSTPLALKDAISSLTPIIKSLPYK